MTESFAPSPSDSFLKFRAASCVVLGGLIGILIGFPLLQMLTPPLSYVALAGCAVFGFLSGYRRRRSAAFFYFALLSLCVLSVVIMLAEVMPSQTQSQTHGQTQSQTRGQTQSQAQSVP